MRSSSNTKSRLFVVLAVFAVLLPAIAVATTGGVDDADDVDGPWDFKTAIHGHEWVEGKRFLRHRLETYEPWATEELADSSLVILFDFEDGRSPDKWITITAAEDGTPYAEMFHADRRRVDGYAKVWRPDDRSIEVVFPRRLLKRGIRSYQWWAQGDYSLQHPEQCTDQGEGVAWTTCDDLTTRVRHRR